MELAVHIRHPDQWQAVSRVGRHLEAIYGNYPEAVDRNEKCNEKQEISRIYVGDEFCMARLPDLNSLKALCRFAADLGKELTFLTPVLTDTGLEKVRPLFEYLAEEFPRTEVVVNDLGTLFFLKSLYPLFPLSVGRLINKGFKDPRLRQRESTGAGGIENDVAQVNRTRTNCVGGESAGVNCAEVEAIGPNATEAEVAGANGAVTKATGTKGAGAEATGTKGAGAEAAGTNGAETDVAGANGAETDVAEANCARSDDLIKESTFDQEEFRGLMEALSVGRVERDLLPWGPSFYGPAGRIETSIYFPLGYFTTGRVCTISSGGTSSRNRFVPRLNCSRPCNRKVSELTHDSFSLPVIQNGNTLFYRYPWEKVLKLLSESGNRTRLVYQGGLLETDADITMEAL